MEHKPAPKRKRYPKGPAKPGEVRPPRGRATIYTPEIAEEVNHQNREGEGARRRAVRMVDAL